MMGCMGIIIDWCMVQVEMFGFFNMQLLLFCIGDDVYKINSLFQVSVLIGIMLGIYIVQYYVRIMYGDLSFMGIIIFVVYFCQGNMIFIFDNNIDCDCVVYLGIDDVIFIFLDGVVLMF